MPKELILSGRVQGVFCRSYCSQYGRKLGIRGAASNLRDGTVQVILDCDDDTANKYVKAITENSLNVKFLGRIENVRVRDYAGTVSGDYTF